MIPRPPGNIEAEFDDKDLKVICRALMWWEPCAKGGLSREQAEARKKELEAAREAQQQRFREGWRWHFAGQLLAASWTDTERNLEIVEELIKELEGGK